MKNKVKPNKQGANPPFINHTQNERGITLIALIVMIILLVLLTMVVRNNRSKYNSDRRI